MRRGRLRIALMSLGIGWSGIVQAGSFGVNPVRVTLAAGRTSSALTVRNTGPEPAVVQLEVASWSQHDGTDVLEPTRELLATPPIFTLAPGGEQVVRIGLRGRVPDGRRELSYRLLLKEVPPETPLPGGGLRMALHVSLPVFVMPTAAVTPALHWSARRDGQLLLTALNDGNMHVQLNGVRLGGDNTSRPAVSGYLLPGQQHAWPVTYDAPAGSPLHLLVSTDAGDLPADIVVGAP